MIENQRERDIDLERIQEREVREINHRGEREIWREGERERLRFLSETRDFSDSGKARLNRRFLNLKERSDKPKPSSQSCVTCGVSDVALLPHTQHD